MRRILILLFLLGQGTQAQTPQEPTQTILEEVSTLNGACPAPFQISPISGAVLDNGCSGGIPFDGWTFTWTAVSSAYTYAIEIQHNGGYVWSANTSGTSYTYNLISQVSDNDLNGWTWHVGAWCTDIGFSGFGPFRPFSVEPLDSDCKIHVAVTRLSSLRDIEISGVSDPIWRGRLNATGSVTQDSPPGDRVIAAAISSGTLDVSAVLNAAPTQPAWNPKVECTYFLDGVPKGKKSFTGWQGIFSGLEVPRTVGIHTLRLAIAIRRSNGTNLKSQDITMPLYVVLSPPVGVGKLPKKVWLEKACVWASGSMNERQVLDNLNSGIFNSGGIYENNWPDWKTYVEGGIGQRVNCVVFSNVWSSMCQVLGVAGTDTPQNKGSKALGFVTNASTSSDGKQGNAYPLVSPGQWDKWDFQMHQIGRKGTFWDPTMNKKYFGFNDFIKWNHTSPIRDSHGNLVGYNADGNHTVLGSPRYNGSWQGRSYDPAAKLLSSSSQNVSGNGQFLGIYSDSAYDDNTDGLFDRLVARARVQISEEGRFLLGAEVLIGDTVVSLRSSWKSTQPSLIDTQLAVGEYTFEIPFSGEDIFNSSLNGPYTIHWSLFDSTFVSLDGADHITAAFSHTSFGEKPARIQSQWDGGQDTDGNGKFDDLCSHVITHISIPGTYTAGGILTVNDSTEIASSASNAQTLDSGVVVINLDFSGPTIKEKGISGPYDLSVWVTDSEGGQSDQASFSTGAYAPGDFDDRPIRLNGIPDTSTIDLGLDGLYDSLVFTVDYAADSVWSITWNGWLLDTAGQFVASAIAETSVGAGTVRLSFSGHEIHGSGISGPYVIAQLVGHSTQLTETFVDLFVTANYSYQQFQSAPPPLVTVLGNFSDVGVDSNGNLLYDYLTVNFDIMTIDSGYVDVSAVLMDGANQDIVSSSDTTFCAGGEVSEVQIHFDATAIYDFRRNGPYYVKGLTMFRVDSVEMLYFDTTIYETSQYLYSSFEHSSLCGDANGTGSISISDAVYLINYIFAGGPPPNPLLSGDANCSGGVNISDAVYIINFIFGGGAAPCSACP